MLLGGAGDDDLAGGAGRDRIDGGTGRDLLHVCHVDTITSRDRSADALIADPPCPRTAGSAPPGTRGTWSLDMLDALAAPLLCRRPACTRRLPSGKRPVARLLTTSVRADRGVRIKLAVRCPRGVRGCRFRRSDVRTVALVEPYPGARPTRIVFLRTTPTTITLPPGGVRTLVLALDRSKLPFLLHLRKVRVQLTAHVSYATAGADEGPLERVRTFRFLLRAPA